MGRLDGKIAIVTGGSTGIGHATCHRFCEEGAKVMIFDVAEETGRKTLGELHGRGFNADFHLVDVRREDQIEAGVKATLTRWGGLNILVNNAGIPGANKMAHECTVVEWDAVFAVNVRGVFLCTKHVLPHMMAQKSGAIVNFSSTYGLVGSDDQPPYHAAKGAVMLMTKTDAICYAKFGIRINAVHPGAVKTPLFIKAGEAYPGGLEHYIATMRVQHPLTLGEPVDVANCVLFLASDEARFMTGSSLVCDGGYTAH